MIRTSWQKFSMLMLSCLLSACASNQSMAPASQSVPNFSKATWQEEGVFGYRNGQQGFSAGYIWQNQKDQYDIHLLGPLGAWHAELLGSEKRAQLTASDGKLLTAANPQLLMQENLGWSIPIENLQHWLWATPVPNIPGEVKRQTDGTVTEIKQAGWVVQYPYYQNFSGHYLPARIILSQDSKKITVVINNFKISK